MEKLYEKYNGNLFQFIGINNLDNSELGLRRVDASL